MMYCFRNRPDDTLLVGQGILMHAEGRLGVRKEASSLIVIRPPRPWYRQYRRCRPSLWPVMQPTAAMMAVVPNHPPALLAVGSLVGEDDKKAPTTASIREVEAISRLQQAAAVWASFIAMRSAPRPWL